jgi:hypothetical protein
MPSLPSAWQKRRSVVSNWLCDAFGESRRRSETRCQHLFAHTNRSELKARTIFRKFNCFSSSSSCSLTPSRTLEPGLCSPAFAFLAACPFWCRRVEGDMTVSTTYRVVLSVASQRSHQSASLMPHTQQPSPGDFAGLSRATCHSHPVVLLSW